MSEGPFSSLNLGFSVKDDPARVEQNLRRFAAAIEVPIEALHTVSQVHGDRLIEARPPAPPGTLAPVSGEADAIHTDRPDAAVGVKTADCVPLLFADPKQRRVAAVHSGWRGTELEIVRRVIERWGSADGVSVAIGPCIRACCYEVSAELGEKFRAAFGPAVIREVRGKGPHLDLVAAIRESLARAGVAPDQVDDLEVCTACDPGRFFSHRRDRGVSGRQLSVVQCRF